MCKNIKTNLEDINELLDTGDIVAFESTTPTSWFIRFFTLSRFSHIAIVRRKGDDLFIYEYPDADSTIKTSNLLDSINKNHVKSVTILKPNREITANQINKLDCDYNERALLGSTYSRSKSLESGLTKVMVVITFITLFIMSLIQAYWTYIRHDPLSLPSAMITFIPVFLLISLIYIKPQIIKIIKSARKNYKKESDYCSGYVVVADSILGGNIYKFIVLESNLTPKNVVYRAKILGYKVIKIDKYK